jgi:hypothetical protein
MMASKRTRGRSLTALLEHKSCLGRRRNPLLRAWRVAMQHERVEFLLVLKRLEFFAERRGGPVMALGALRASETRPTAGKGETPHRRDVVPRGARQSAPWMATLATRPRSSLTHVGDAAACHRSFEPVPEPPEPVRQ